MTHDKRKKPEHVIEKLQDPKHDGMIADQHSDVTVLFSDIVGFTKMTSTKPTLEIIEMLNFLFSEFDDLTEKHDVYKVETIGDAYMVAAGHVRGDRNPTERVLRMAMDMLKVVDRIGGGLQIRIGIHHGEAHTGVVGVKMPRFCFFGDTINTASRMESTGFPMCIQVSEIVHDLAQHLHDFSFCHCESLVASPFCS